MIDYTSIIDEWLEKGTTYKPFSQQIKTIFNIAFENTLIPGQSYFGFPNSKNSINLMYQRIYLIGIFDKRIEIIVDKDISNEINYEVRKIGISRTKELELFWVSTRIKDINDLIANNIIWEHYKLATLKITSFSNLIGTRIDWLKGKYLLSDIYNIERKLDFDVNKEFEKLIEVSIKDNRENRLFRLKNADIKPKIIETYAKTFVRNADVIAETLLRANGYCEHCRKPAPFIKDIDNQPYLEVHHKIPLADNGDDTIENTIALCPNCHRQAHYGKKTFKYN